MAFDGHANVGLGVVERQYTGNCLVAAVMVGGESENAGSELRYTIAAVELLAALDGRRLFDDVEEFLRCIES